MTYECECVRLFVLELAVLHSVSHFLPGMSRIKAGVMDEWTLCLWEHMFSSKIDSAILSGLNKRPKNEIFHH